MAEPFHVAFLGVGTAFVYANGVLCYAAGHGRLRLLDIKNSADHEIVIDVFQMLQSNCLKVPASTYHKLKPLHYGHGILTFALTLKCDQSVSYLVAIRPHIPELLLFEEQSLHGKIIVETTDRYLFIGHPMRNTLWNYWGLRQFDLDTRQWAHQQPRFTSPAGRNDGTVVCTIHDNALYAVSCSDPLIIFRYEMARLVCHAARAPLSGAHDTRIEILFTAPAWAQALTENVTDARWNFLRVEKDEKTGKIGVIQIKVEYPQQGHHMTRTCVKGELLFPSSSSATHLGNVQGQLSVHDLARESVEDYANSHDVSEGNHNGSGSTDSQALHFISDAVVHHGDNSSTKPLYGVSQCFIRSYFSSTNSFVDLVNNNLRHSGHEQSLRLRVMTALPDGGNKIAFWPPEYSPHNPDRRFIELRRIMNPPNFNGDLEWEVDSSSFVYSMRVDAVSHSKAFIYVGFDPTVKLYNLKPFNKSRFKGNETNKQHVRKTWRPLESVFEDEPPTPVFPPLGAPWAWMEEPLYFRPREKNGFDFFG